VAAIRTAAVAVLAALLAAGALAAPACSLAPAADPVRNVILISIDTLRADRLGAYGGTKIHTPAFDGFAADSVLFEEAFTPVPLTAPSHSTMLTGRYPIAHGVRMNGSAILSPEETTLAEVARDHGMRTAAIVSCLVLASRFGLNQGFDLYYDEGISGEGEHHGLWYDERKAVKSIDRAMRWLESESDKPFFLWLHLFDPHHPYEPPPPFDKTYAQNPYNGEVVYVDRALGIFFAKLKELGVYDDSLIVVTGDHGESLGEHQENFHATFVYDATAHIPFMIRAPGGGRGARVTDIASTLDIFPTALDAMGIPIPDNVQGVSLLPAVLGRGRVPARALYLESIYPSATYGWAEVRGARLPGLKFIDTPKPELYDLTEDPRELKNIYDLDPARRDRAKEDYEDLSARLHETARENADTAALDDEFRSRLLSLGYIAGSESKMRTGEARDPKDVILLTETFGYGGDLLKDKKYEEAEEILKLGLKADPENKLGLVKLGQTLSALGKDAEAEATLRKAAAVYPDSEEIHRILGWMLIRRQEYGKAQEVMADLVLNSPRSAMAHYLYGFTFFYDKKWGKALEALDHSWELSEQNAKTAYLRAICLEELGRRADALDALREYLDREPNVEALFHDPYFAKLRETDDFRKLVRRYL